MHVPVPVSNSIVLLLTWQKEMRHGEHMHTPGLVSNLMRKVGAGPGKQTKYKIRGAAGVIHDDKVRLHDLHYDKV
jgi:hypothetical protein